MKSEKARPAGNAADPALPTQDLARTEPPHPRGIVPVVGIGASAGGLEALKSFFTHVPGDSDMAFVVVQHLDPDHTGLLPELLQRTTSMTVVEAKDRMKVRPGWVYVIPPNKDMSILHGQLHLLDPVAPRGQRLPVDFFFRSLADDLRQSAIGVILSGMGSDGTLGLRAIKDKSGLALVQEPASARFSGMPRSAIDAGLANVVAPAGDLAARLTAYLRRTRLPARQEAAQEIKARSALEKIILLLRDRTGNDFSYYKKNTLYRRVERRMGIHQIDTIADYVRYLRSNPLELDLLFKELLIGVTSFFRDPAVWQRIADEVLPAMISANPAGKALRAWVPACSTGEEAYSLAMLFRETLGRLKPEGRFTLQIFATDLDRDAIDRARSGHYNTSIAADVSPERLSRFFHQEPDGYRIGKEIREMLVFAPQNVLMDPPFTRLDILSCRNLLIYLGPELQKRLVPLFHYALNPGGVLLLGTSETIGGFTSLFSPLDGKVRVYRRGDKPAAETAVDFPTLSFTAAPNYREESQMAKPLANLQSLADQMLLQNFAPAAALVNAAGDILYTSGRTGKYLEPAAGKANWNIHVMAREGIRHELGNALRKVTEQGGETRLEALRIISEEGDRSVNLVVRAIENPDGLRGMVMVVFSDVPAPRPRRARRGAMDGVTEELRAELQRAHDEIQTLREEMQTSREELTSTNEELQSTNEELQSTNEELTTSKEELQSMNEELQTVNAELQSKVDDLSLLNNDMSNLLNSTEIATVFLDSAQRVRRFTSQATKLFKLIPGDVGRPLSDIASTLLYADFRDDAREVLRTLAFSDKQVPTSDGRWFRARIMPYRTIDNVIDGVVVTFIDITDSKSLEAELRRARHAEEATKGEA